MKMLCILQEPTLYFPEEQWFNICKFSVPSDFIEHNYCKKWESTICIYVFIDTNSLFHLPSCDVFSHLPYFCLRLVVLNLGCTFNLLGAFKKSWCPGPILDQVIGNPYGGLSILKFRCTWVVLVPSQGWEPLSYTTSCLSGPLNPVPHPEYLEPPQVGCCFSLALRTCP